MGIVAAGVHNAVVGGAVIYFVGFANGEGVDIGAEGDAMCGGGFFAVQESDGAGVGDGLYVLDAEAGELLADIIGGVVFLEGEFGVAVEVLAEVVELGCMGLGEGLYFVFEHIVKYFLILMNFGG